MLYELGRQYIPEDPYYDIPAEQKVHAARSNAAYQWLVKQPTRVAEKLRVLQVRCPTQGCLLGEVYEFPLREGGRRYLARCITTRKNHIGFINWAFSDDWAGPRVWYPTSCRHGQAKIERAWLLDLVMLMWDLSYSAETAQRAREQMLESEQPGASKGIFYPKAQAWRPKIRP